MFFCGQRIYVLGSKNFTVEKGEVVDIASDFITLVSDDSEIERIPYKFVTGIVIFQRGDEEDDEEIDGEEG